MIVLRADIVLREMLYKDNNSHCLNSNFNK